MRACALLRFTIFFIGLFDTAFSQPAPTINYFIFPIGGGYTNYYRDDPIWSIGSVQEIQWTTTYPVYDIVLYQQDLNKAAAYPASVIYSMSTRARAEVQVLTSPTGTSTGAGNQAFNWTVQTYNASIADSPVFYLWLTTSSNKDKWVASHYFNVTNEVSSSVTPTSTSEPTSSSSTASSTSSDALTSTTTSIPIISSTTPEQHTSSTSTSAATPTDTTIASPTSGTESKQASQPPTDDEHITTIALGVGLGVGIPLILFAGIFIGYKFVKQRNAPPPRSAVAPPVYSLKDDSSLKELNGQHDYAINPHSHFIYEAPAGSKSPAELGGSEYLDHGSEAKSQRR